MRLRLSIRRNGLPESLITWAIDTTPSPTIYQLLEQVNEVVPIESHGEWGLEDYAVELKGSNGVNYECLHFQNIASVMKEDDEVMKRSFSGRTRITTDSKRLFDGVTRLLHSAFPNSSLDVCKYVLTGTNGDLAEAWEAMSLGFPASKSLNLVKYFKNRRIEKPRDRESVSKNAVALYNPENSNTLRSKPENGVIKSRTDDNILKQFDKGGLPSASIASGKTLSCVAKVARKFNNFSKNPRSVSNSSSHAIQFSSNARLTDSNKQIIDTASKIKNVNLKSSGTDENDPHNNALSNKTKNGTTSSSCSSATSVNQFESISDSYSASSDDSCCDSSSENQEPEESSSKKNVEMQRDTKGILPKKSIAQPTVAPGQGKKATQLRNKRKRISNLIRRQKEKGILPVGISKEELIAMYNKRNSSAANKQKSTEFELEISNIKSLNKAGMDDEFQRRRKVLLDSLACGGVDISFDLPRSEEIPPEEKKLSKASGSELVPHIQAIAVESELNLSKAKASGLLETDTEKISVATEVSKIHQPYIPQADQLQLKEVNQKPTKSSQRLMLNLDAGKRMVFAAMGFKPPVTEQDKELIRKELMNNLKLNSSKNTQEIHAETTDVVDETEYSEAWRDKIIYRAKECVQADVQLCEPPFPFVQRWDPQQTTKKRKIISDSRTQNKGSNENFTKRQKKNREKNSGEENFESSSDLSHKEIIQNEDYEHPDDLIPLPDNSSSLPNLQVEQIKSGMIIIFKQLEVSAATRWQPQISSYKTATVLSQVRGKIQVQLARRDFHTAEKLYNEKGERIYSGFDTIDIDETEDDGWRELHFNELIEPKILQDAENNNVEGSQTSTDS